MMQAAATLKQKRVLAVSDGAAKIGPTHSRAWIFQARLSAISMSAGEEWANLASRSRAHTATTQGSYREQKWVRRQKKVFKNWVNLRIAGRNVQPVKDLFVDLQDGWVMYHLCEALGGTSLRSLGKMSKGKMRLHHVALVGLLVLPVLAWVRLRPRGGLPPDRRDLPGAVRYRQGRPAGAQAQRRSV